MKILIAYDGSEPADIAIDSLQRAGLPAQNVEARVVSVGEVWLPPASDEDDTFSSQPPAGLAEARERAAQVMEEAETLAHRGSKRVQQIFSGWQVSDEVRNGSPGFELLNYAREWQADLIVVGSLGLSAHN